MCVMQYEISHRTNATFSTSSETPSSPMIPPSTPHMKISQHQEYLQLPFPNASFPNDTIPTTATPQVHCTAQPSGARTFRHPDGTLQNGLFIGQG